MNSLKYFRTEYRRERRHEPRHHRLRSGQDGRDSGLVRPEPKFTEERAAAHSDIERIVHAIARAMGEHDHADTATPPRPRQPWTSPASSAANQPRGLDRHAAAAFVGLSPTAFDKARKDKKYPDPTLPGGRYDRSLLERVLDRYSGIKGSEEPISALDEWRAARDAGSS